MCGNSKICELCTNFFASDTIWILLHCSQKQFIDWKLRWNYEKSIRLTRLGKTHLIWGFIITELSLLILSQNIFSALLILCFYIFYFWSDSTLASIPTVYPTASLSRLSPQLLHIFPRQNQGKPAWIHFKRYFIEKIMYFQNKPSLHNHRTFIHYDQHLVSQNNDKMLITEIEKW